MEVIEAANTAEVLGPVGPIPSERQARELSPIARTVPTYALLRELAQRTPECLYKQVQGVLLVAWSGALTRTPVVAAITGGAYPSIAVRSYAAGFRED